LTDDAWCVLALDQVITAAVILRHASNWPADEHIEVRRCRDCGRAIARKVRMGAPSAGLRGSIAP
jgi:hypothetical protein